MTPSKDETLKRLDEDPGVQLIRHLMMFVDPSNWDHDSKEGVEYDAWIDATGQIGQLIDDFQQLIYDNGKARKGLESPTPAADEREELAWTICPKVKPWMDSDDIEPHPCRKCTDIETAYGGSAPLCLLTMRSVADAILAAGWRRGQEVVEGVEVTRVVKDASGDMLSLVGSRRIADALLTEFHISRRSKPTSPGGEKP